MVLPQADGLEAALPQKAVPPQADDLEEGLPKEAVLPPWVDDLETALPQEAVLVTHQDQVNDLEAALPQEVEGPEAVLPLRQTVRKRLCLRNRFWFHLRW